MACGTFTRHYGERMPVYCSICKPLNRMDGLRKVTVEVDYTLPEERIILLTVGKMSVLMSKEEASRLTVLLGHTLQDMDLEGVKHEIL